MTILSMVLLLGLFLVPGMKTNAAEAQKAGTVYASIEKFTVGQGYLVEPTAVEFKAGDTYADILENLLKTHGYTYNITRTYGYYLDRIDNADSGKVNIPKCIQGMSTAAGLLTETNPCKNNGLGTGSYSSYGGWMYFINGKSTSNTMDKEKAKDGDVVRYQFSLISGGDLGDESVTSWGGEYIVLPKREEITKKLAIMSQNPDYKQNPEWVNAYNQAIAAVSNLDISETELKNAESKLPTAVQITDWTKEQARKKAEADAKKQAEEAQNALIKKNTPAKTTLKNVKKSSQNKAQLTWKKVKGATGYEVYQSTKKNGTYKKVKTIKKNKVITVKTKSLKKKKTYFFKIRTYKTVDGKKYYGAFSNVKKIRVK